MWDAHRTKPIRRRREVPMSQAGPDGIPIISLDTDESNDLSSGYGTHSAESPNLQITISQSDSEPNERRVTENDSAINSEQDNPSGNTENRFVLVQNDNNLTVTTNANSDSQTVSTYPTSNVRSGESLHLLFPQIDPLLCTEVGCTADYSSQCWSSNKNSLKRHLREHHEIKITSTRFWCTFCQSNIDRLSKHTCLNSTNVMIFIENSNQYPCNLCTRVFRTEIGLRNHIQNHREKEAESRRPPLVVPEIV
ncbi:hypothetical protein AVEN_14019-1 [Araneus ventricosus]|uniref:C2H2-type domain-containing protein n=1 Tax=Araneus ventricosus TaxID=182803 RepID=A0A4Y2N0K4_ARAVE|nr:hypothetical protein AVEN_14019-1 [Araneus ventricosus]